ncbi:amino acid adenylation domain-containing protein [Burkholderia sp. FERM BP-3421]|uniref:non-ribosomal peptide synthetase n=1 Tax=Burkholderia sp. FERM BP-3421 TaxID=1494466 RepID=UPI002363025B|nr:non-ribosomal peptide synthetase [Burkholderia sp. FERM BP-3421]WDD94211.1 amino acid adenylation domain-containing protein [Burkholderia sp. FERM BP-3421]
MTSFPTALHHRIHALARLAPDAPALASFTPGTVRLTRGELDDRAARLAAQLTAAGVTTEVRVGVCVARSCDLFVALLAVLKAGGVFVALDPRHPGARLDWVARDAGLAHGIVDASADAAMRARFARCFEVASVAEPDPAAPRTPGDAPVHPRAAAYMIYTSGSTGTPKAVVVEHGPLAAHGDALAASLPIGADDRVLHFASVNFDVAIEAWLVPLAVGGSVVISDPPPFAPQTAHAFMVREGVTNTTLPPAYLREFAAVCARDGVPPSLRVLLFGGEAMSQDSFDEIRRVFPAQRLVNGYGPTEAVISPMLWPVDPGATPALDPSQGYASLPIGWPIGRRVARIDGGAPQGADGELLLGGVCLARGYHGRPGLTAERFLPDPGGEPGERIYRTGDLARERADGSFDYLGRIDDQVQVRGVRVEPGEIAACLLAHPAVSDAGVLAETAGGRTQLTACVVLTEPLADAALKAHLGAHLPAAWLPHRFARFTRLPYTLNGKLDRVALRDSVAALPAVADDDHVAPVGATETRLAALWQRLLDEAAPLGRTDRFFARGGDSLGAMQLQAAIRAEWGVALRLEALFDDATLAELAAAIEQGEPDAAAPARALKIEAASADLSTPYRDRPASFAQQRFWVLARTQDAGDAYHVAVQWDIDGLLDPAVLQRALDHLLARHEAWRTTLVEDDDGVVWQRIHRRLPVTLATVDLRGLDDAVRAARLADLTRQHAGAAFDLSGGPLVRATLVTLTGGAQHFLLTTHHAVSDGWSSRCAFDELTRAYAAFAEGREPASPALPIQYADYAQAQRAMLAGGEGARQLDYWREALAQAPAPLALPLDRARGAAADHRGGRVALRLSAGLSEALRDTARQLRASPFTLLLAAFDAWLFRLTGERDLVVAAPVADRAQAETRPLVGLFLNTLALRARVSPAQRFAALVDAVRRDAVAAFAHQDVPFDQVLDAVQPPARRGEAWLKVKFAQQFDLALSASLPGATARMAAGLDLGARFDYALDFTDDPQGIELVAAFALDGIDADTARAWLDSYAALLADAVRDPRQPIAALACASAATRAPQRGRALATTEHVLARFARAAAEAPQRAAVVDADASLSFAALDAWSDRLAHALRRRGAGPEQAVALRFERTTRFVAAWLGVLKSGAYAVPLDPAAPPERLAAALDACGARWLLVEGAGLDAAAAAALGDAATPLDVDALGGEPAPAEARLPAPLPGQAAYLIFTSGSTGTPKGVVIDHRALADYVDGLLDELAFAPDASMAMVSTVAADLGHTTLFGALCSGRTLHLLPASCAFDPDRFAHEMRSRDVGVLKIVPSHLHALLDAQAAADVLPAHALVTGGEALPWSLVARLAALKPACRVINHYGPTEATVGALVCDLSAPAQAVLREAALAAPGALGVPLGRPLPNADACVLDASGAPVPPGGIGELYLGGPGLARGYLRRAGATAERFVPDPFTPGARLYRTGDRVRLRADGRIAFLGRLDDQVKIRGYRVEPGEVSAALRALDGVAQAETLAVEHEGRLRLASFVTPAAGARLDDAALRCALAARLPDYMVPAVLQVCASLPVTANGKIDRAALRVLAAAPAPVADRPADAPQGPVETVLAAVWQEVLKTGRIGREDDFFALGGDSILVLQVIARARKRGVKFTPKQLFDGPTVAKLARVAVATDAAAPAAATRAAPAAAQADAPMLLPAQRRFFALDIPRRGHWNQSIELTPAAPFDFDAFTRAFDTVLTHHAVFRQRFTPTGPQGEWQPSEAPRAFDTLPLAAGVARDETDALAQFDALQAGLDLERGPLACAFAAALPDGATRLYLAIHHLIVDGVTWRVLLDDLDAAYRAAAERRAVRLASTGASASQWAARLARAARDPHGPFAAELPGWAALAAPHEDLPLDHPDARATNADAAVVIQALDADLTRRALTEANGAYRTQMVELLIAALAQALGRQTGQAACRIELEGHGREALFDELDASRTPGWLTSHYPVAFAVADTPLATLAGVKDSLRDVPNKGLGFGVLRHYGDDAARTALAAVPRPRVTFNYLGQFDAPRDAALVPRFGGAGLERDPGGPIGNALAIHAYIDAHDGRTLRVHWVYGATQFERATIDALAARFSAALTELTDACAERLASRGAGATPGDYPLARAAGLTQAALERLPFDLRTIDDIYPLAPMQQGILFHALFAPEQSTYVNQLVATLDAPDIARLRAAFEAAPPRHDILRTGFTADEAAPMQVVHRQATLPVEELDWRNLAERDAALDAWLAADRARGFDLAAPPLMRVALIRFGDTEWRLVWTRHHLLLDGWSTARCFADVLRDYLEPPRPNPFAAPARVRYRDFIAWLASRDAASERAFWLDRLARLDEPTLIAEREPQPGETGANRTWRATLDAATTARVGDAARQLKITVNTLVQGAWALALQRVTNRAAVAFGATVAGRPDALAEIDTVLGLFINTLPVIAAPLPQRSARGWLADLQRDNAAALDHAHTPLYEIQQWAGQGGRALFDTLVVFENYPVDEAWQGREPRALQKRDLRNIEATDFALTLVIEAGQTLTIDYGYDTARLGEARVAALHDAFVACLGGLVAAPDAPLGALACASDATLARAAQANATARDWPAAQQAPLHRQFEAAAQATPDAIALEMTEPSGAARRLSYRELDQQAERAAAALRVAGVLPDTAVALCVERSFDMVIALLGVLKAGAAYLPVDPDYPADRIDYLLRDARPAVVLTQAHLRERVAAAVAGATPVVTVDALLQGAPEPGARTAVAADQLAYLIYTSGSTGKPKGAGNTHAALANRIAWMQDAYRLTRDDVVLHKTPFGFDVSVWEFVWPLAIGATLAIAAPGDHRDPARLVETIAAHRVTTLHFVPSMLAAFVAHLDDFGVAARCASITRIVASGEALAPALVARVQALLPHARLFNLYGPTEAAIDVSHWTCTADDGRAAAVPIGHPIANLQLHVLDVAGHPAPEGGIGELHLGGAGLARGYLGRAALTAERFVPDPSGGGARLYRTGDLVRRRADGALDYLGRLDAQVKLRGQRLEPGEIEALLRAAPGVRDAVVIVHDDQLVGYVAHGANPAPDAAALLDALRAQLPAYMVPSQLIALEALPVTPNGKCDRRALPTPERAARAVTPPRTETERTLAGIWQRALKLDAVGCDDDFFTLGGHSLLATQVNAQANLHWALTLPLRQLFEERTLARCAAVIDHALAARGGLSGQDAADAIDALLGELEIQ